MSKTEGVSILGAMVADVESKVARGEARTLTPLTGETGSRDPLPMTPASFPHDRPSESVGVAIAEINRAIEELTKTRDALQLLAGDPVVSQAEEKRRAEVAQKLAEREADRQHDKRAAVAEAMEDATYTPEKFRVLQADAMSATFSWTCPDHPDATPKDDKSPKGREFKRCTAEGCKQFEK